MLVSWYNFLFWRVSVFCIDMSVYVYVYMLIFNIFFVWLKIKEKYVNV